MTVCDRLPKMTRLIRTAMSATAEDVARLFVDNIVRLHGVPESIVSDRDPKFTSAFWKSLMRLLDVRLRTSTVHHPQTDGQTERMNQTAEAVVRTLVNNSQSDWASKLPLVEISMNGHVNRSTKQSPFYTVHGYDRPMPSIKVLRSFDGGPLAMAHATHLDRVLDTAHENIRIANHQMAEYYDMSREKHKFSIGDRVLISRSLANPEYLAATRNVSLSDRWIGPYRIVRAIGCNAFELDMPSDIQIHPVISVIFMKPYIESTRFSRYSTRNQQPTEVDGEEECRIEKIVAHRDTRHKRQYLVRWRGYDPSYDSWLYEHEQENTRALVRRYKGRSRDQDAEVDR